jgi:peptidoglycan hydrolase CwlO-like protein
MDKQKKKLLNDIESSENKINRANKEIDDCNREIPQNEEKQKELREKIAQQQTIVQKFTDKLNTVKVY